MEISEIFYSIQGEGLKTGTPTIFIRFYGCNYDCSFCDEPLHKTVKNKMSKDEILSKTKEFNCKNITITGGEPTLHNLNSFIEFLQKNKYYVNIETNGHNIDNVSFANWITCSPKFKEMIVDKRVSEYKIVSSNNSDIEEALQYAEICKNVFIQPINNKDTIDNKNLKFCIDSILKYPQLKLSVQLHKILGVE